MKKKACKRCKLLVASGDTCPSCGSGLFSPTWQGRIAFVDAKNSKIAQKIGVDKDGEYAIKVK